ncbi:MAG: DegV family protein [Lachnospiraceae bacterium]|nr:DegV family protein [Lachnospiraceae bacterium]MDY5741453.1 DegV family protein [Lachnospiraceae bacterium]
MSFRIVIDSCGELTEWMKADEHFVSVPLTIQLGEEVITDDDSFDREAFFQKLESNGAVPKTACPSPQAYMEAFSAEVDRVYCVTLSDRLSGSYGSAMVGRQMLLEEQPDKQVYIFNSCSASIGETLIAMVIWSLEEKGMNFEEVIRHTEDYILGQNTYFTLNTLEMLIKSGRLKGLKALIASTLHIKPIMGSNQDGEIIQLGTARGSLQKALKKIADMIIARVKNPEHKILAISHCSNAEAAEQLKLMVMEKITLKDVIILDTHGISTVYAGKGGVIAVV